MSQSPDNLARVSQVKVGIATYLEALDTLPADTKVSVQLGVVLAAEREVSIEEAKTFLRKFNQALTYFKADQVVIPTLAVVPVNESEKQLYAAVAEIYKTKVGPVDANQEKAPEAQAVSSAVDQTASSGQGAS